MKFQKLVVIAIVSVAAFAAMANACPELLQGLARLRLQSILTAFPNLLQEIQNGQIGPYRNNGSLFGNNGNNFQNTPNNNNGFTNPSNNNNQNPLNRVFPNNGQGLNNINNNGLPVNPNSNSNGNGQTNGQGNQLNGNPQPTNGANSQPLISP